MLQIDASEFKAHPLILMTEWCVSFAAIFISWSSIPMPQLGQVLTLLVMFTIFLNTGYRCVIPVFIALVYFNIHNLNSLAVNILTNVFVVSIVCYSAHLAKSIYTSYKQSKGKDIQNDSEKPTAQNHDKSRFATHLENEFFTDSPFSFIMYIKKFKEKFSDQQYVVISNALKDEFTDKFAQYMKLKTNPKRSNKDDNLETQAINDATMNKFLIHAQSITGHTLEPSHAYLKTYSTDEGFDEIDIKSDSEIIVLIYFETAGGTPSLELSKGAQQFSLEPSKGDIIIFDNAISDVKQHAFEGKKQIIMFLHYKKP